VLDASNSMTPTFSRGRFWILALSTVGLLCTASGQAASIQDIDVGGLKLGLTVSEVHTILEAKGLPQSKEYKMYLTFRDDGNAGNSARLPNSDFVSEITAGTIIRNAGEDHEEFNIHFSPNPGEERVVGIVHTVTYSPRNAIRLVDFENTIAQKYAEFRRSTDNDLPAARSWMLGLHGLEELPPASPCSVYSSTGGRAMVALPVDRQPDGNLVLTLALSGTGFASRPWKTARCGPVELEVSGVTVQNQHAPLQARTITHYTVSIFSSSLADEGFAAAAKLTKAASEASDRAASERASRRPSAQP
jgi:hypothetical protein